MAYFAAGSKEDDILSEKMNAMFSKKTKKSDDTDQDLEEEEYEEDVDEREDQIIRRRSKEERNKENKKIFNKGRRTRKIIGLFLLGGLIIGSVVLYKAQTTLSKITTGKTGIFGSFLKGKDDLMGMEQGQINILLIGVRGENIPGGSLLADSIILAMFRPEEDKVALVSLPRDMYVPIAGKNYSTKINEANPIGEEAGEGQGLELMKKTVSNITGVDVHYAISANFNALRDTIDVMGGIDIHLDEPFYEGTQFVDGNECGGEFSLPAGDITLSGEKALCYSRARYASSDFDRARRQQQVLMAIKNKALSAGTLTDFSKLNNLINVMGNNVKTDMEAWEMKNLFSVFKGMEDPKMYKRVFSTGKDGLLYSSTSENGAYILLPEGNNFDKIKRACSDIWIEEAETKKAEENSKKNSQEING
ncbi:MAG: hypothetical protein GF347_02830 [Candidatus Moranbacteria bacterium]|nr:hypothetical protein [Candidatus Moranbacteria bacterium]